MNKRVGNIILIIWLTDSNPMISGYYIDGEQMEMINRKKILIYDYLFVQGHMHPNMHYINLLSNNYDVYVASINGYFNCFSENNNIKIIDIYTRFSVRELRKKRRYQIQVSAAISKAARKNAINHILFLSYDTPSFFISRLFYKRGCMLVIQEHNNIDRLKQRKIELWMYKSFANKTKHIVYEKFMKESLVRNYAVNEKMIFVLPRAKYAYNICRTQKKYSAIGLSGSNDMLFVDKIIHYAEKNAAHLKGINILLKTSGNFSGNAIVKIINKRVTDEEYEELFNSTRIILDPLPSTFEYRMSAVLFEGLSSRKIIIGTDTMIIRDFALRYPHICFVAGNEGELFKIIQNISPIETEEEKIEFDKFNDDYNDEKTMCVFSSIFG